MTQASSWVYVWESLQYLTLRDKHKNVHSCDEYGSKKQEHSR